MPFRLCADGITWECDTATEAIQLQQLLSIKRKPPEQSLQKFARILSNNGRSVVTTLLGYPEGRSTDELAECLSFSIAVLGPVMKGIATAERHSGFHKNSIIRCQRIYVQGRPKSRYCISPEYIEELGSLIGSDPINSHPATPQ